jgi:predicted nuclease with TOPRIM domain
LRQKELELEIDKIKLEMQRLEAQGSIDVARAKMAELEASQELTPAKKTELETTIKLAEAKLKLSDALGKSINARQDDIDLIKAGVKALGGESGALNNNTSARGENTRAIDENTSARERAVQAGEKELALKEREEKLKQKQRGVDENGFTTGKDGKAISAEIPTWMSIFNQLKSRGVPDAEAKKITNEFANLDGSIPYFDNPGQLRYSNGDRSLTLGAAVDRAAEYTLGG